MFNPDCKSNGSAIHLLRNLLLILFGLTQVLGCAKQERENSIGDAAPHKADKKEHDQSARSSSSQMASHSGPQEKVEPVNKMVASSQSKITGDLKAYEVSNPYYERPVWKLWTEDPSSVMVNETEVSLSQIKKQVFPMENDEKIFEFSSEKNENDSWAGFQDDVYVNFDRRHSWVPAQYAIGNCQVDIRENVLALPKTNLHAVGANFVSQSTTGMGADLANNKKRMEAVEQLLYFSNTVLCTPTHNSYMERFSTQAVDSYQALMPCYFNSIGSSKSEIDAISKMMIAGAYLDSDLKKRIKRLGMYAPTLLYIWKAGLPFGCKFEHPLRHRVAYLSRGDNLNFIGTANFNVNSDFHQYDEEAHIRKMVEIAKHMKDVPPVTMTEVVECNGGKLEYSLLSGSLVTQKEETVVLRVSVEKAFLHHSGVDDVTFRRLSGNPFTTIEPSGKNEFKITVPWNKDLPTCRTSIAFFAKANGAYGNPSIINVFSDRQRKINTRPSLPRESSHTLVRGETLRIPFQVLDAEGHRFEVFGFPDRDFVFENNVLSLKGQDRVGVVRTRICVLDELGASASTSIEIKTVDFLCGLEATPTENKREFNFELQFEGDEKSLKNIDWNIDGVVKSGFRVSHVFDHPGIYTVSAKVIKNDGQQSCADLEIEVPVDEQGLLEIPLSQLAKKFKVPFNAQYKQVQLKRLNGQSRFPLVNIPTGPIAIHLRMVKAGNGERSGLVFDDQILGYHGTLKNDPFHKFIAVAPIKNDGKINGTIAGKRIRLANDDWDLQLFIDSEKDGKRNVNGVLSNPLDRRQFQFKVASLKSLDLECGPRGIYRLKSLKISKSPQ